MEPYGWELMAVVRPLRLPELQQPPALAAEQQQPPLVETPLLSVALKQASQRVVDSTMTASSSISRRTESGLAKSVEPT
jgi:hypothetical protein